MTRAPGLCARTSRGTGRHGVGAARVEDLYLVLEDGVELLTPFSYELDPTAAA